MAIADSISLHPPEIADIMMIVMAEARRNNLSIIALVTVTFLFAALAGVAFAGWLGYGDNMFFSMIQSGIAWCF